MLRPSAQAVAALPGAPARTFPQKGGGIGVSVPRADSGTGQRPQSNDYSRGRNLLLIGGISYFVLARAASWLPGAASISSVGSNLAVVGLCLLGLSWRRRGIGSRTGVIALALSLPLITTLSAGFLGFGVSALVQACSFFAGSFRFRLRHLFAACVILWLGLSGYVSYMASRKEIREAVWGGAGIVERVVVVSRTLIYLQPFDPWNSKHLYAIDARMNQNSLVGRAIHYIEQEKKDLAYGRTLGYAAIAWIPRALWPGKPAFGGSIGLVSQYTGMTFGKTTSVGIGNVLEFYVNFGMPGICVGFVLFGMFVRFLDQRAAAALESGNSWDYVFFHLVGISALQPGGIWAEAAGSCAAAVLLVAVLRRMNIRP